MTRLTLRRGGTRRLRATLYADLAAGDRRDLTGLSALVVDQSPNIALPVITIRSPPTSGEIEVLWTDEQTANLKPGAGRVWLIIGLENGAGEREVLPVLTFDVE
ncbi:MAG: hypothetical protein RSE16_00990 [Sphingobium sp.]|jgi:hypothetical protein|nr:MAG: hypothetical protein RSE16_00990 [Sphingobium sp.]